MQPRFFFLPAYVDYNPLTLAQVSNKVNRARGLISTVEPQTFENLGVRPDLSFGSYTGRNSICPKLA
jgi:hypothetical protein